MNIPPRGFTVKDNAQVKFIQNFTDRLNTISSLYNLQWINTPIVDKFSTFISSGEFSDIVHKEMFHLQSKSSDTLVLRPEQTAQILKYTQENHRYISIGPMYRYERPQLGRLREFTQCNFEFIHNTHNIYDIFDSFSIIQNLIPQCEFHINYIGNQSERSEYLHQLKQFYTSKILQLSSLSQKRLENNILRILDSKESEDISINQEAPKILNYISQESTIYFQKVQDVCNTLNIQWKINQQLVRGLDYYDGLVWECTFKNQTILGGGEYTIDQRKGIGWAIGLDRLPTPNITPPPIITVINLDVDKYYFKLMTLLRTHYTDINLQSIHTKSLSKGMKKTSLNTKWIIIIGETEYQNNTVIIRDCISKTNHTISMDIQEIYVIIQN